jgi:ketosteroid isomerase-like protein
VSAENVELVRRLFDAFNRRDAEAMLAGMHSDFEWRPSLSPGGIEGNVYRGGDAIRRWLDEVSESWEVMEVHASDHRVIDERRVLVLGRLRIRGRASGVPLEHELAHVWELDDGRARRAVAYPSRAEALAAAGLEA